MIELLIDNIDIPVKSDNIDLKGSLYYNRDTKEKAPFIIILPGFLEYRESGFVKYFSEKFAGAGYYVLSYDYRAHGETKIKHGYRWNKIFPLIFSDIHVILEWILENQSDKLLKDKIALFGRSLGGAIVLSHGYIDERAKILIALSPRYDYHTTQIKFQEETVRKISPIYYLKEDKISNDRILIGHSKDDNRIPFENLLQIKKHLGLNDENAIEYESGGHSFKGNREDFFRRSLKFLKKIF